MLKSIVPLESTDLNLKRAMYLVVSKKMIISELKELKNQGLKEMNCLSLTKFRKNSRSFKF